MVVNPVQEDLERFEQELDEDAATLDEVPLDVPIAELHIRNHATIGPDATVGDAIEQMLDLNVGCLPVVEDDRLLGILTERDLLLKVAPDFDDVDSRTVREVMVANPTTIRADADIEEAIRLMHAGHYRHLPVVDETGRVTAVVSVRNIVEYLIDHFPAEVLNLPPEPIERKPMPAPEGA